jgi:hypothetical protein
MVPFPAWTITYSGSESGRIAEGAIVMVF